LIVPDTSAWVEYLRATGAPVHLTLRGLIETEAEIAFTEYVAMEVLAGARSQRELTELESLVLTYPILALNGLADYQEAAALYRACRAGGETIRKLSDCLVAIPAMRADAAILHRDADFDAIARHSELRIYPVDGE
jgi:predicted nucleic acid-binding protein